MKKKMFAFLVSLGFLVAMNTHARDEDKLHTEVPGREDFFLWFHDFIRKTGNPAMDYHLKGREYIVQGKYPEAIRYLKLADSAFRCPILEHELRDKPARYWQAKQLGEIARAFRFWGFYDSAMSYHRKSLTGLTRSGIPLPDVDVANQCEGIGLICTFWGEYDSARHYFLLSKDMRTDKSDWLGVGACCDGLGQISFLLGNHREAVRYLQDALAVKPRHNELKERRRVTSYKESLAFSHLLLGKVYAEWGFTETAFREYNASLGLCRSIGFISGETDVLIGIGKIYLQSGQYDLAAIEFEKAMVLCKKAGDKHGEAVVLKCRGDLHHMSGDMHKALLVYNQASMLAGKTGNPVEQAELDLRIGKTLLLLGRKDDAGTYLVNSIAVAGRLKLQKTTMEAEVELSGLFEQQGRTGEALALFKKVVSIRESQRRENTGLVLTDMDARHQADENVLNILLLTKEKQLKDLRIKKFNSFLAIAAALIVMAVLLLLLVIRNTRMKVAYRSALLQHRLFSSQFNPQVVYGGLNDIMQYIKRSETESAAKYLSHFSRFLQTTLYGTQKEFIPLEKEMLQVQNYLDLQQMCHPGLFSFLVSPPGDSDPGELAIPPFLVQPFLANAVGTVIKTRPGNGRISVSFQVKENVLSVSLDHNSIPGETTGTADMPVEEAFLKALTLTRERLAIIWKKGRKTKFVRFSAITDPATGEPISRVRIELPVIRI